MINFCSLFDDLIEGHSVVSSGFTRAFQLFSRKSKLKENTCLLWTNLILMGAVTVNRNRKCFGWVERPHNMGYNVL